MVSLLRIRYDVLGGLVSPAHATEVRTRYRQQPLEIIPPRHRLAMARCAVGDSTWLTVDPWEITRKRVMDYMSVLEHVTQLIEACFPGLNVKVRVC
jgi:nicotinic acid mononucleotide adenylyltransferase